jgi:hypothetical protein
VRALAAALGDPDLDETALVEEGGAFLALLLVDALPAARHVERAGAHRLRIARGVFDPFAALDAALDADDPRAALAAAIRAAEAEARGEGPVSRVLVAFEARLGAERPDLAVARSDGALAVLADGTEVDLARVVTATATEDTEAVVRAVARVGSMIPRGGAAPAEPWANVRDDVLPRLVGAAFLADLRSRGAATTLALAPLAPGVDVALVVAQTDRARFVRAAELASWGCAPDDALRVAVGNLAARSDTARFFRADTDDGPMLVARTGDGLDSARVLLPGLRDVLARELGLPALVAVPHRDALLAAPPALADALARSAESELARAPHPICAMPFAWTPR